MLSAVCIGNLMGFWTRFANSKANVRVENQVEPKRTAMEPIIMSTCCCVESCDIQILLQGFGIGVIIQGLRGLLRIFVVVFGDVFRVTRPYSTGGVCVIEV